MKITVMLAFFNLFSFKNENRYRTVANKRPVLWGKKSGFVDSGFVKTCDELVTCLQKKFKVF